MLKTFKRFQSALALSGTRIDPYQISHPTPRDRIANLEVLARESPYFETQDPPELQRRHDRMRAKIAAFTQEKGSTAQLFRQDNKATDAKQYGEAIEGYLHGNPRAALAKVDALIKAEPNNPYHYELRGDTLMKANRPAEAADAYAKAIKLDPRRSSVLQVSYGQALLAQGNAKAARKATQALQKAVAADPENTTAYRYLAQAYGQLGLVGQAELAAADGHYYSGNFQDAKIFAARAQRKLKPGSAEWQRAQDIINYRKPRG
jgi:predicted Zn-dependent protease